LHPALVTAVEAVTTEQLIDRSLRKFETELKRIVGVSLKRIFMHCHQM